MFYILDEMMKKNCTTIEYGINTYLDISMTLFLKHIRWKLSFYSDSVMMNPGYNKEFSPITLVITDFYCIHFKDARDLKT